MNEISKNYKKYEIYKVVNFNIKWTFFISKKKIIYIYN